MYSSSFLFQDTCMWNLFQLESCGIIFSVGVVAHLRCALRTPYMDRASFFLPVEIQWDDSFSFYFFNRESDIRCRLIELGLFFLLLFDHRYIKQRFFFLLWFGQPRKHCVPFKRFFLPMILLIDPHRNNFVPPDWWLVISNEHGNF